MVGLNPETAHETMSGLSFYHAVAQTIWHGKLFHIDLNGQKMGRYDQDLRFGSEGLKDAFFLVKLLEESGYTGPRHFDAHAYRTENADGVWDFAAGCMRTYLILKEKAARFATDPEIAAALAAASVPDLAVPSVGAYSSAAAAALQSDPGDPDALAVRGYHNEALDQLVIELLMGVR
jgi:xylose isomerase